MFSMATVASSTRMPTAKARPPKVMRLIVSFKALRMAIELSTERGIEIAIMKVLRQEPMKSRIISAVSVAAIIPSRKTPLMAARTNNDWSANSRTSRSCDKPLRIRGMAALTRFTTSIVEAEPLLSTVSNAPLAPSLRTMFCCG